MAEEYSYALVRCKAYLFFIVSLNNDGYGFVC